MWELVEKGHTGDDRARRLPVPGGWLYQVEGCDFHEPVDHGEPGKRVYGWSAPVFVPDRGEP